MARCSTRKSKRPLRIKNRFDGGGLVRKYATAGPLVLPQTVTPDMLYGTKVTPGINPLAPQPNLSTTLNVPVPTVQETAAKLGSASSGLSSIASAGIGAAGTAIGQLGNSLISHGLSSGVGNAIGNIGGTIGGAISAVNPVVGSIVSAGSGILGGITNALFGSKLNEENIANVEGNISNIRNTQYSGDFDDITATRATQEGAMGFNKKYIGSDGLFSNKAKNKYNTLKQQQAAAVSQADANMANATNNAEKQIDFNAMANYSALGGLLYPYPYSPAGLYNVGDALPYGYMQDRLDLAQQKLNAEGADTDLSNVFALGGGIHINPKNKGKLTATAKRTGKSFSELAHSKNPLTRKRAIFALNARKWHHGKKHALGGDLQSNGADWNLGFTTIGNGGTHEMNPNEGVQMGMDNQGIPNLVEQGEVVYNNYVFSNRLSAPKELLKQIGLPTSYADMSFANIAEKISKESKERPNDPISNRGLDANMNKLMQAQEYVRQQEQANRTKEMINNMSPEELQGLMAMANQGMQQQAQDQAMQEQAAQEQMMAQQGIDPNALGAEALYGACGGRLGRRFDEGGDKIKIAERLLADWQQNYADPFGNPLRPATRADILGTPEFNILDPSTYENRAATLNEVQQAAVASAKRKEAANQESNKGSGLANLRYFPVLGSAVGLAYNLFHKPDYSNAERIEEAAQNIGYMPVKAEPIGNYLQYTPIDRNFYTNQLAAQANAQRRALINLSNANRGTAAANILASDYNRIKNLGDLAFNAEKTNWERRKDVGEFNRQTNQFNAQQAFEAARANQEAKMKASSQTLSGILAAAKMRQDLADNREGSTMANLTNLFDNIGNIGWEAYNRNTIQNLKSLGYGINSRGATYYIPSTLPESQTAAYGGRIKKNRRRKHA